MLFRSVGELLIGVRIGLGALVEHGAKSLHLADEVAQDIVMASIHEAPIAEHASQPRRGFVDRSERAGKREVLGAFLDPVQVENPRREVIGCEFDDRLELGEDLGVVDVLGIPLEGGLHVGKLVDCGLKVFRALGDREVRSEEHTSELQSRRNLVCRLLLEKKKEKK